MTDPILRHAGSATGHTPGASYGNQQFAGNGLSKLCDCCGKQRRIANGWTRYGPGKVLHRCPECSIERAARKSGVAT